MKVQFIQINRFATEYNFSSSSIITKNKRMIFSNIFERKTNRINRGKGYVYIEYNYFYQAFRDNR